MGVYGWSVNPIALRKAKIAYNFGLSKRNRVNRTLLFLGRLRPPKRLTSTKCPYFHQLLTTALRDSVEGGYSHRKDFIINFYKSMWPDRSHQTCYLSCFVTLPFPRKYVNGIQTICLYNYPFLKNGLVQTEI